MKRWQSWHFASALNRKHHEKMKNIYSNKLSFFIKTFAEILGKSCPFCIIIWVKQRIISEMILSRLLDEDSKIHRDSKQIRRRSFWCLSACFPMKQIPFSFSQIWRIAWGLLDKISQQTVVSLCVCVGLLFELLVVVCHWVCLVWSCEPAGCFASVCLFRYKLFALDMNESQSHCTGKL